ncbi:hypothetical protein C8R46DRAFT_1195022 [Mycena filopes]|nr:hypothetical protein C8R46DRAFT_1195022 [Mycena filopes]
MSSTPEFSAPCVRCGFPASAPRMAIVEPIPAPAEFIRSNHLPPDSVIARAHREMAVAATGIALVEEKMAHLKQVLEQLQLREQGLREFVADHQRIVAPIRRLPTELLAEILSYAVSSDSTSEWDTTANVGWTEWDPTTNAEWILARVSRAWRAVLTSMSQIWSHITIYHPSWTRTKNIDLKAALLLQLDRSAHTPLTIRFSFMLSSEERISVLEALFAAKDRWQDVDIHLTEGEFRRFSPATTFPMLRKLGLSVNSSMHNCDLTTVFQATPSLQELQFNGRTNTWYSSSNPQTTVSRIQAFPLAQLTKLDLSNFECDLSHLLVVFELASNIVGLRINHCGIRADVQLGSKRKTLPNLVSLEVIESTEIFMLHIDTPALQRLAFTFSDNDLEMPVSLVAFMQRTGHSLDHLTLSNPEADEPLLSLLSLAPQITTLSLEVYQIRSHFVEALSCGHGERNLVPCIVTLELKGRLNGCDRNTLLMMLVSRCVPGPLRVARIRGFFGMQDHAEQLGTLGLTLE